MDVRVLSAKEVKKLILAEGARMDDNEDPPISRAKSVVILLALVAVAVFAVIALNATRPILAITQ